MNKRFVIPSDSHVLDTPDLRLDRINPKYRDSSSHLETSEPYDQWYCNEQGIGVLGGISQPRKRSSRPQNIILDENFANVHLSECGPYIHRQNLNACGICAKILCPSIALNLWCLHRAMISIYPRSSETYESPIYESI